MNRQNYIIIHKKEWDRIKRADKSTNKFKEREDYFKSLNEQSQKYIEKWSDSVQGHINKFERRNQMKYAKAIQTVKDFNSIKKPNNNKDVIKKARELIFQDSCYGRQLLSALLESKALEEREAQLKFQRELNEKSEVQRKIEPKTTSLPIGNDTESDEKQRKLNKKQTNVEIAQINKALYEKKYKEDINKRDKEKQDELENESLMKQILINEIKLQTEILNREQAEVKKYEKQNDKIKKAREKAAQKEDLIRKVWYKYNDKIKCREKTVLDKIHKESFNATRSTNAYKIVEQLHYEKDKKYNDFIETGINRHVKRLNEQDQQELESKTIERNKRQLIDKDNKMLLELKQLIDLNIDSNCCTESLYVQGVPVNKEKTSKTKRAVKPFLAPRNTLLESLKTRENDTSSWNGVGDAHAQFAEYASDILRQCRYKNMARKVIKDYSRNNCIDEKYLQISD